MPDRNSVLHLGGAVLAERDEEWLTSRRYFGQESLAAVSQPTVDATAVELVTTLAQTA